MRTISIRPQARGAQFDPDLVEAARDGDPRAREELADASLALVHSIVSRCLPDPQDTDDVVQETLLTVVRDLPTLKDSASYRSWLTVIAVHQVGAHQRRKRTEPTAVLDLTTAEELPRAELGVDDRVAVERELSVQRRQVASAVRWLDPRDRVLLSLWWLETAGHLTRNDLAEATGLSPAHAAVRVRRMRGQLDLTRAVVAALQVRPRCRGLSAATAGWDGVPSPLWRKRLSRHVRECRACTKAASGHLSADWLLLGPALLPAPLALGVALAAKLGAGTAVAATPTAAPVLGATAAAAGAGHGLAAAGVVSRLARTLALHPVAAAATAGTLVTGAAITTAVWTADLPVPTHTARPAAAPVPSHRHAGATKAADSAPSRPGGPVGEPVAATSPASLTPSATPSAPVLSSDTEVSLEASAFPGRFVMVARGDTQAKIAFPDLHDPRSRRRASLQVVPGLADASCVTFRLADGRYLRHRQFRLEIWNDEGTRIFREDATFCPEPSSIDGTVRLRSFNYPNRYLRHKNFLLYLDDNTAGQPYLSDSSWLVRAPLEP